MNTINNGGPAFPNTHVYETWTDYQSGMTLRDYFAVKAMQGYIHRAVTEMDMEDVAIDAYEMADTMLRARETK